MFLLFKKFVSVINSITGLKKIQTIARFLINHFYKERDHFQTRKNETRALKENITMSSFSFKCFSVFWPKRKKRGLFENRNDATKQKHKND